MKKFIVVMIMMVALISSAFATDLSYLEDFEVKEGDEVCVVMDINDDAETISFRIYLNEDKTNPDNFCNRIYRITEGGRFEDSIFEVVSITFSGMDYTPLMKGYEFTGEELIENIEIDLRVFQDIAPGVDIDSEGSYYYGYNVNLQDMYNFMSEVSDYLN